MFPTPTPSKSQMHHLRCAIFFVLFLVNLLCSVKYPFKSQTDKQRQIKSHVMYAPPAKKNHTWHLLALQTELETRVALLSTDVVHICRCSSTLGFILGVALQIKLDNKCGSM